MWRPEWLGWHKAGRFDKASRFVLRLGQAQFQLWSIDGHSLQRMSVVDSTHLRAHSGLADEGAVADCIRQVLHALPHSARLDVVMDTRWMPAVQLLTGAAPLRAEQIQALARHRFADLFGEVARQWPVQTSYVEGDEVAMAFTCPQGLMDAVRTAVLGLDGSHGARRHVGSVRPTFAWVWDRIWQPARASRDAWLIVAEHDRSLMARVRRGTLQAFHASAPVLQGLTQVEDALRVEALRCGISDGHEVRYVGVSFEAMPAPMAAMAPWHVLEHVEAVP